LHVAGKPVLGHILDSLKVLNIDEIIFITGDMENHIVDYVGKNYSFKSSFIKQKEMLGDGQAISLAKEKAAGDVIVVFVDVIVVFVDTLFVADIKKDIKNIGSAEGIVWTSKTEDPKRFGIVEVKDDHIISIEEKPEIPKSDQAVIGLYYFKDAKKMFDYLEKIIDKKVNTKGEYRLADALSMMINDGVRLKSESVNIWLDCGKPETLIETNRYLLSHGREKVKWYNDCVIKHPVYIEPSVSAENSVIGPNVSIARGSKIINSIISNSIIGEDAIIENAIIDSSLVGDKAELIYEKKKLNVGDSTQIHSSH
jgi:glucose-1-phosphate thymidylyltransferase